MAVLRCGREHCSSKGDFGVALGAFLGFSVVLLLVICIANRLYRRRSHRLAVMEQEKKRILAMDRIKRYTIKCSHEKWRGLHKQASSETCSICLVEFTSIDDILGLRLCTHSFHPECIEEWLCEHTSCPMCRCDIGADAEIQEYFNTFDCMTPPLDGSITVKETEEALQTLLKAQGHEDDLIPLAEAAAKRANSADGDGQDDSIAFPEFRQVVHDLLGENASNLLHRFSSLRNNQDRSIGYSLVSIDSMFS